jgi:hypothetical protein
MTRSSLRFLVCCTLLSSFAAAQMSTLPAAQAIADLPGPPKNPPIFSEMTVILQGGLEFENTIDISGPVAEVQRVDQLQSQSETAERRVTTLKFDDQERLVKRISQDMLGSTTTTNIFREGKLQSQTVDYHSTSHGDWQEWQRWSYDEHGRVSDFRAGRDKVEWNHYLNFKYDAQDRPLGYEYLDSKIGGSPIFTELSYSGKIVTMNRFGDNRRKFFEQVQILDDQNRVIDLKVSDLSGGELKQWYHVKFEYDAKGRVTEQTTDPFKLGSGDDYSPIPGKLVVDYDDEKHSGEQTFFDTDGKLVLHTTFAFDHNGALTKLRVVSPSDKKRAVGDSQSHKLSKGRGGVEWEVIYDDRGNWTERRHWFIPTDGSPRIMTRLVKQNISYR